MTAISLYSFYDLFFNPLHLFRRLNDWINPVLRVCRDTLTTLPPEIIVEIVKELDWHSLLHVRQTCKYLDGISRAYEVWIGQYRQYVAQHVRTARLEEPLPSYSAKELERWVLLRRSADVGWSSEDVRFTLKRHIKLPDIEGNDIGGALLVPGGRWLLIGGIDGFVAACDLNASIITLEPLIPSDEDRQRVHFIAIDMESANQCPKLTFTMALSPPSHLGLPSGHFPLKIQVWEITLTGHGDTARLVANVLSSFEADDTCGIKGIEIRENFFARTHYRNAFSYIEVFDWRHSTSTAHCKAIILPGMPIEAIRLLPDNRLLAFSRENMMIYSFKTIGGMDVSAPTVTSLVTEPLWKLPFPGTRTDRGGLSAGISDENASYFVVKAKSLYSLLVPRHDHQAPCFQELMGFDHRGIPTCAIGFQKALIQHSDRSITRLSFSGKPQDGDDIDVCPSSCAITSRDYPTTPTGARLPKLDEETGRIVQDLKDGVMIIDSAILYRKFHIGDS